MSGTAVVPPAGNVSAGGFVVLAVIVCVIYALLWISRNGWPEGLRRPLPDWTSDIDEGPDIDMSGHDVRSSDGADTPDPGRAPDMSDVHRKPTLDREGWAVEPDPDRVRVSIPRTRPTATRPADVPPRPRAELTPEQAARKPTPAERQAWLLARSQPGDAVAAGKSVKELDEMAKDLFGVTDRQLRRDRMLIKKRAGA